MQNAAFAERVKRAQIASQNRPRQTERIVERREAPALDVAYFILGAFWMFFAAHVWLDFEGVKALIAGFELSAINQKSVVVLAIVAATMAVVAAIGNIIRLPFGQVRWHTRMALAFGHVAGGVLGAAPMFLG